MRKSAQWLGLLLVFAMIAAACGQGEEVTATTVAPVEEETATTEAPVEEAEEPEEEMEEEMMDVAFDGVSVTEDTIYIGMLADLSGPFATLIKDIVDAEIATFDDYNANGGVAGQWQIEVLVEDTGYDVTVHGEKYDELSDKVVAFTQSTGSPHTTSIAEKLVEDDLIAIPLSWYSGWADPALGENVIEQGPNYCIEAMSVVEWMTERYQEENGSDPTWGVVSLPGEYGQDGASGAKYAIEALDLELVYDGEGLAAREGNTEVIAGLVGASPDLVFNTLTPGGLGEVFGGTTQSGLTEAQWGGSGPSYNYALLSSPIGPLLSERYTQSGYYAPYGADVEGMDEVRRIVSAAYPDRQITDALTRGYLEARIMILALEDAAAAGDLTPAGVTNAAKNLEPIDFGGLVPGGVQGWSGEPNDFLLRSIQIYDIDISLFDPSATVVDGVSDNIGFVALETAYLGSLAAEYDYQGPCFVGG